MYLALRDLRFARGRFLLMGAVVALIALLGVLLSGMSTGLTDSGVSGLRALPVNGFAFSADASGELFSRSTVTRSQWEQWSRSPGVQDAAPFGDALAHATVTAGAVPGTQVDVAVFGVVPGSFLDPAPASGRALATLPAGTDGVLVSRQVLDEGVRVGDHLGIDRSGVVLTVVGTVDTQSYGHVAVAYAPLATWQKIHYGLPGELPAAARDVATAVAAKTGAGFHAAAADHAAGTHWVTKPASYSASPGYSAESGTMKLISWFLYVISALVVGSFFTVWTVQRKPEIALLKAIGASGGYVVRDALAQAAAVLLLATAGGTAIGLAVGRTLMGSAPFSLRPAPVATAALSLVVLGLIGASVAVRRIMSVDPLTALGADR
ncbi:FtsX-like permease family protein [Catenulispora subtropica]|uniref:ABC transporter permease n=1 Tax=Catenulispora subtropica TaxID=450798 RepID=A0ABN2T7P1_9ACTN